MSVKQWGSLLWVAAAFSAQAIESNGVLLVDVKVSTLSGLGNNAAVAAWTNAGTLGGNFVPAVSGQGAVYQTGVAGTPAVTFAASANSVMTNTVPPPSSILSNNVWSAELWVLNPSLAGTEDQFSWTDRGNWTGSADGTCMEIRYCADANNAVEHYNGSCNIPWNGNPPTAGVWHHIAITRSADGSERLYADGVLRTTKTPAVSNLRAGAPFAMGGVWDRALASWQMLFSGSLAQVRVHSGTLTGAQVLSNFLEDRETYQSIWNGTPSTEQAWENSAHWLSNNVAVSGSTAWITNGGTAVLSGSLALNHLYPDFGGLVVTNGATLALGAQDSVNMGNSGRPFALTIASGALKMPGAGTVNLYLGNGGGDVSAAVGGRGAAALLDVDRDTVLANSAGSVGALALGAGGSVYNSNGWFYVANSIGASASVTVDGGTLGFRLADKAFVVNVNGARGEVTVNSGAVSATGDFKWSGTLSTNTAYGKVQLNGGTIEGKRFFGETTAGTNLLYLNGGTVKARVSASDFLYNLTGAYVQNGGAVFEVPAGATVTAAQALLADAGSTGGLTKLGAGRITFAGANTFTGPVDVQGGDLFFSHVNGLAAGYGSPVSVANEGSVGYNTVGGATLLNGLLTAGSSGYLTLFPSNAADNVTFAALPNMKLAFQGVVLYTGTFTPYQGQYDFKVEGATVTNGATLTDDGATPGHLNVTGVAGGGMVLTGNNTYSGGTEVDAATVTLGHANALGVQAAAGVPDIFLRNGAALRFVADMDINALVTGRLDTASAGILLVGAANASKNIDLSNHPGIVVGSADGSLDYTGTLTPSSAIDTYRLGGGSPTYAGTPNRGFAVSNLADGAEANKVVIGTPGLVELKSGNTYSGGTTVTNRGVLFLREDGLGAVPASAAAGVNNLFVSNGVIRAANANFTLHANRGVHVAAGTGGLELHPWGGYTMTVAGNLSGSGPITVTDSGWVTFGGAANTYSGLLDISGGRNIRIGDGANFSWSPAGTFTLNGMLALKSNGSTAFSNALAGAGSLRKEGSGDLTLSGSKTYSGITYVDAGSLKVAATNVLPRGSGKGVVEIAAGARLEANGADLLVGGLQGVGAVTNSPATPATLYLGETNVTATFGGTVDPSLTLVKIGAGKQTLTNAVGAAADVKVSAGTLELFGPAAVTGTVTLDGGTLGVTYGGNGLTGRYYQLAVPPVTSDFVSYAAVTNFLNGKTPSVVSNSLAFGATFNPGVSSAGNQTGARFPAPFNAYNTSNFAVLWSGYFFAPVAGSYGFATASDDGSMVFVDGQTALDNNAMQSYTAAESNTVGSVTLTAGLHQIDIAYYEAGGDQGVTVWVKLPGAASVAELPQSLLFTGLDVGSARVGALAGSKGSVSFAAAGLPELRVTGAGDMAYGGSVLGSNALSRLVKEGSGALALSSSQSDFFGVLDIRAGVLALTNGPATLGTLAMADGVRADVSGRAGLNMWFYHRSAADANYSEFQSLTAWESYVSTTFPSGPNYVTNSLMLGANLDTGASGTAWPTPYVQGVGAEQETFDAYLFGSIYLDRSGTYTFATASDDGSMLYIDRTLVVNNGYDQGVTTRSGTIALTAGFHTIDILYRENTGGNALQVSIGYPGQATTLMPQSILFGGAALRGLAGESGSTLRLLPGASLVLAQNADTEHAGTIAGDASTSVQKNGVGTLTLTDENAGFAGTYRIIAGALRVGNGGATGSLGPTAAVLVEAAGTLVFDRTGTVTVSGPLAGTGRIVLDGPGEVYVTSTNAFAGTVVINNGRLTLAPGATLGTAAVVTNTAALEVETTGSLLQGGVMASLAGSGDLAVSGTGTLVLNNSNTNFTGTTHVLTGATVRVSRPANLGGFGDVALDGGTLAVLPDVTQGTNEMVSALDTNTWKRNGAAVWATRYDSQWLQLTPNTGSQAGSAFCTNRVDCSAPWYAAFRYEVGDHPAAAADGATFILQNDTDGASALGASGGQLGVDTISPSIGVFINIYNAASVGWIVNGARADAVTALNGIIPTNGMDVALSYDGVALKLTLTQGVNTYTATRTVDLAATFGGNPVFVGFTGGTGGATAQQFVGNFSMFDAVPTSTDFGNTLTVAECLTGHLAASVVSDDLSIGFAALDLGSGSTLNIAAGVGSRADAGYTVAVRNLTVASGLGTVHVAANGTAAGVLGLERLTLGSGAQLVVTGAVSVPGGVLTVVVPTPVPRGVTYLADFTGASWVGGQPVIVLVDENGNPIDETVSLRNGLLYINTANGTLIRIK